MCVGGFVCDHTVLFLWGKYASLGVRLVCVWLPPGAAASAPLTGGPRVPVALCPAFGTIGFCWLFLVLSFSHLCWCEALSYCEFNLHFHKDE